MTIKMFNASLLSLFKILKIPIENEMGLNMDYAANYLWHQKLKNSYNNLNNENKKLMDRLHQTLAKRSNINDDLIKPTDNDFWVFGYGSLIWKADFPYIDKKKGFIKGFQRRFYQESIDHRGTREHPGRVVTLLPSEDELDRVYGVAYRIPSQIKNDVIKHLDHREKNGYERHQLTFHVYPELTEPNFDLVMYIASKENSSYAGDVWQTDDIARQILISAGPSGPNREYLFSLTNSMRILFPDVEDKHLNELEAKLNQMIEEEETQLLVKAIERELLKIAEHPKVHHHQVQGLLTEMESKLQENGGKEMYLREVVQLKQSRKPVSSS